MTFPPRFIPRDFIAIERGLIMMATLRDPARWEWARLEPAERSFYDELGYRFSSESLRNDFLFMIPTEAEENPEILERVKDYYDALNDLREALYAGEIIAQFLDSSGQLTPILNEVWGTDQGEKILICGMVPLRHDGRDAPALLSLEKLEAFARTRVWQQLTFDFDMRPQETNKGGRPPEFNWEDAKDYCLSLVKQYGRPNRLNSKLPRQEDLVVLTIKHFSAKDQHPSVSNVRKKVATWLTQF
jgi:hypothetical protein